MISVLFTPTVGPKVLRLILEYPWNGDRMIVQFSSVFQFCLTLCDPMDCSTLSFHVHHQLPELAQSHVHCISDAIRPSHSLSSPSPPALNPSISVFSYESALHIRWPNNWSFTFSISHSGEYSGLQVIQ